MNLPQLRSMWIGICTCAISGVVFVVSVVMIMTVQPGGHREHFWRFLIFASTGVFVMGVYTCISAIAGSLLNSARKTRDDQDR